MVLSTTATAQHVAQLLCARPKLTESFNVQVTPAAPWFGSLFAVAEAVE